MAPLAGGVGTRGIWEVLEARIGRHYSVVDNRYFLDYLKSEISIAIF